MSFYMFPQNVNAIVVSNFLDLLSLFFEKAKAGQHYLWILPTSSGNCTQRKNHFHVISRKLNTDELNFLIKTDPGKKATGLKRIDLFTYLFI